MSSAPSLFASPHHPRPDSSDLEPAAKRAKDDSEDVLQQLGAHCVVCFSLPVDCAMLQPSCACNILVCWTCYQDMVTVTGSRRDPDTRVRANLVGFKTILDFWSIPSSLFEYTLTSCPTCRFEDPQFTVMRSAEWGWLRKLHAAVAHSIPPQEFKLTHRDHTHETDQEWADCSLSRFPLWCPADGCKATLHIHVQTDVRTQVEGHMLSKDCKGVVECVSCSRHVFNSRWHYKVGVRQLKAHLDLHRKLYSLWSMCHETDVRASAWWTMACCVFKGLPRKNEPFGGQSTTVMASSPLDRVCNAVGYNAEWCDAWFNGFRSSMETHFRGRPVRPTHHEMANLAFPMFFNAGYHAIDGA